ncbi:hypothetical protein FQR65_LT04278 [Abscondita terminalis]|nr:hypothetical protein FQR65_LT04278 [Abscondita terminalis]
MSLETKDKLIKDRPQHLFFNNNVFKYHRQSVLSHNVIPASVYIAKYNYEDFYYNDLAYSDFNTLSDNEWIANFIVDLFFKIKYHNRIDFVFIASTNLEHFNINNESLNKFENVQNNKIIIMPLLKVDHWILIIANGKEKEFYVLDSFNTENYKTLYFDKFIDLLHNLGIPTEI